MLTNGEVFINDKKSAMDIKDGLFTFENLKSGYYRIKVKSNNVQFEEKTVNIDLTGSGALQPFGLPHHMILKLAKFVPKSFDVCGRIVMLSGKMDKSEIIKNIKIKSTSDKLINVALLDNKLNFCLNLEANNSYTIKTEFSDSFKQKFKMEETVVEVVEGPLFNITFEIRSLNNPIQIALYSVPFIFLFSYFGYNIYYSSLNNIGNQNNINFNTNVVAN